jgi:hypothetical protein
MSCAQMLTHGCSPRIPEPGCPLPTPCQRVAPSWFQDMTALSSYRNTYTGASQHTYPYPLSHISACSPSHKHTCARVSGPQSFPKLQCWPIKLQVPLPSTSRTQLGSIQNCQLSNRALHSGPRMIHTSMHPSDIRMLSHTYPHALSHKPT